MGHGSSAFQGLSDDQKLSMLQHLKGSYDEKMKEFDGLHKNDRIKALRTKQAELRKKIDALRASFSLVKSNFCMNCISIWGFIVDSGMPCSIETQAKRSLFSRYDAGAGADDGVLNNRNAEPLPLLHLPSNKGKIKHKEGEIKDLLITLAVEAKLADTYYPSSLQDKIHSVLDFRDKILYPGNVFRSFFWGINEITNSKKN